MNVKSKTKNTAERKGSVALHYTPLVNALDKRLAREEAKDIYDTTLSSKINHTRATAIYDLLRSCPPDFITQPLLDVISRAALSRRLPVPTFAEDETETAEQSIEMVADILLLANGDGFQWRTDPNSRAALAQHIAAILKHPLMPTDFYNSIADSLTDWESALLEAEGKTPTFIERALAYFSGEQPAGESQPRHTQPARKHRRVAESISAILSDPNTPVEVSQGILDGLAQIDDDGGVNTNPNYVEAILIQHAEEEKGGAR